MIDIAICDDEKKILDDLSQRVNGILEDVDVSCYSDGRSLISDIEKRSFDIIMLDIDMPEMNGLTVAENIPQMAVKPLIIFVTSHDELVYDSLMLHPFGFVRKTHMDDELKKILKDAEKEVNSSEKHFFFHTASGDVKLRLEDILYFESEGNYIKVITAEEKYRFRETMQTLEISLSTDGFVRIHKGFLLNPDCVKMLKTDSVILCNDVQLPFGRSYLESARKKLMRGMIR